MRESVFSVAQCAAETHFVGLIVLGLSAAHSHIAEFLLAFPHCVMYMLVFSSRR